MWKALSRSVCEVVERRVGVTAIQNDIPNRKKPDSTNCKKICHGQLSCYIPRLKTIYHERLKSIWSRENICVHSGEKQQDENKNHARWTDTPINACTMGWSTVLILAWYLCQPLGRRLFGDSYYLEIQQHSPPYFSFGNAVHAQSPIQPLTIHPLSYSSSIQDKASETNSFNSSLTSSSSDDVNDFFTHERGPFTPEEALNEVTRVFHEASRTLSGDVENRLGMDCMSKGQHTEAMKHFRRASHHKHAVAAYNMGQCYELGLGTVRSLSKAAKWYKISSDRGHPTAMYNLAVFLANGWGGLQEDTRRARELLIMASSLGLKQAEIALKSIDGDFYVYNSNSNSQEMERKSSTDKFLEMIGGLSNKESEKSGDVKFQQTRTYLSHLDLSVLSSPLSPNSSEVSSGFGETYSFPGSDSCILSSDSVEGVKCDNHESSDSLLFVVDSNESISSGMESLDEASNCGVFTRPL